MLEWYYFVSDVVSSGDHITGFIKLVCPSIGDTNFDSISPLKSTIYYLNNLLKYFEAR